MKNLLLIGGILCCSFATIAQEHATNATQCQLTVDDILSQQWFDIDDPISEDARYIIFELYSELNSIYAANSNNLTDDVQALIPEFMETLDRAATIEMNLAMFADDVAFVESLNQ